MPASLVEQRLDEIGIDSGVPDVPEYDPTGGIDPSELNRGGKVQSFMNIKK